MPTRAHVTYRSKYTIIVTNTATSHGGMDIQPTTLRTTSKGGWEFVSITFPTFDQADACSNELMNNHSGIMVMTRAFGDWHNV
jgi:hypothetical protein